MTSNLFQPLQLTFFSSSCLKYIDYPEHDELLMDKSVEDVNIRIGLRNTKCCSKITCIFGNEDESNFV